MSHQIPNIKVQCSSSSSEPLSLPALTDPSGSSEATPIDEVSVLNQFGYRPLGKICDTLQGELIIAETLPSEHKPSKTVAIKRTSKELYAAKVTRDADGTNFVVDEDILSECLLLHRATVTNKCPGGYICQFIHSFHSNSDYYLVMEYVSSRTTLRDFVRKAHDFIAKGLLDKKEWIRIVKFISWQLVVTLHYLHNTLKIAHNDLTMDNVMVQGGEFVFAGDGIRIQRDVNIKVVDFGLATFILPTRFCEIQHPAFSLTAKCPQIFNDEIYDAAKADIWSLGQLVFCMMFRCAPFSKQTASDSRYCWLSRGQIVEVIRRKNPSSMPVTVRLVALLRDTMQFKEKRRADISSVLRHGYLKSYYQRYKADFEGKAPSGGGGKERGGGPERGA